MLSRMAALLPSPRSLARFKAPGAPLKACCVYAMVSLMGAAPARHSLSVAVVGGGAAGLISARELLHAGHHVTMFERSTNVGGVWDYSEEVEDDLLGQGQHRVHGSMYAQLRTNLPRQVMGTRGFPFDAHFQGSRDSRQFCGHEEVRRYLEAFVEEFGLRQHVRFETEVQHLAPVQPTQATSQNSSSSSDPAGTSTSRWLQWEITARPVQQGRGASASTTEQFDAVVVANGHYSRPRLPQIAGQDIFPNLQMHSHNYRRPEPFTGKVVAILGASSSGVDIAEEIANVGAKQVYLCAREWENPLTGEVLKIGDSSTWFQGSGGSSGQGDGGGCKVVMAPNFEELHADGSITLADGSRIEAVDVCMYCTGYCYDFPFQATGTGLITVEDNRVGPLYQHVFPPAAAPTLSFVGLTWKVVPFPQFELQSRWIAQVLSGAVQLPSRQDMEQHTIDFYKSLEAAGIPVRYTHRQSDGVQWHYNRWLLQQCGEEPDPGWREELYKACGLSRKLNASRYRDVPLPGTEKAEQAMREEAARVRQQRGAAASTACT